MKKGCIFRVLVALVIIILGFFHFDEETSYNTYSYESAISDIEYHSRSGAGSWVEFNTSKGKAFYKFYRYYSPFSDEQEMTEAQYLQILNTIAEQKHVITLTATSEKNNLSIFNCRGYDRIIEISYNNNTFISMDIHNKEQKIDFIIFCIIMMLYLLLVLIHYFAYNIILLFAKIKKGM